MAKSKQKPEDLKLIASQLETFRLEWEPTFDELEKWFVPYIADDNSKVQPNKNLLNPTPAVAASYFASGFTEGVISRTREWFKLSIPGFELDGDSEAARWLSEVERRIRLVLSNTNFYQTLGQAFWSMGVFGNGAAYIEEDEKSIIRCHHVPIGQFAYTTNETGRIVTVLRVFKMTARDIVRRFGEKNTPEDVRDAASQPQSSLQRFKVYHLTTEKQSAYWLDGQEPDQFLELRPLREWPWAIPRWEPLSNEPYATGLGLAAVGPARMLQHAELRRMKGLDKMENPPVLVDALLAQNVDGFVPGSITAVPGLMNSAAAPVQPAYKVVPPLQEFQLDIARLESIIKTIFFNDLFLMISQLDTVRSATEIIERREEKMTMLGPVLQRIETEVLAPALDRVFGIMWRKGLIPEPPPAVVQLGGELQVQYISMLYQAQQASGTIAIERLLATTGNAVAVWPEIKDKPNIDNIFDDYAKKLGISPANVRSEEEVNQLRQQRAQVEAQQAAAEQAGQLAQAGKVLSETDVGGGANALQMLIGGLG